MTSQNIGAISRLIFAQVCCKSKIYHGDIRFETEFGTKLLLWKKLNSE